MRRIIVINTKGGSGKTTVATNLAACYASRGFSTALLDYDPQGSALAWLKARPAEAARITAVAEYDSSRAPLSGAWQLHVPRDTQRVVVDTPAGISASDLVGRISKHDTVLIPIQASAIDIRASADFVRDLLLTARIPPDSGRVGLIANRTRKNSQSLQMLDRFLASQKLPVVAYLHDALPYLTAAEDGLGVCELSPCKATKEPAEAIEAIIDWLDRDCSDAPIRDTRSKPTITRSSASNEALSAGSELQQAIQRPRPAPANNGSSAVSGAAPKPQPTFRENAGLRAAAPAEPRIPAFLRN